MNVVSPLDDFQILYFINYCNHIEKMFEDNHPADIKEKIYDKISKNFTELDNMKKEELEIIEKKHWIEINYQK